MSEPYAALARFTIPRDRMIAYLDAAPTPASAWQDWSELGGDWYDFDYTRDLPRLLAEIDSTLAGDYRSEWVAFLRYAELPAFGRFEYDESSGTATIATLTLARNLNHIVWFVSLVRGVGSYLDPAGEAIAIVRRYLWGKRHVPAALRVTASGSRFSPADETETRQALGREADAVFDAIFDAAGAEESGQQDNVAIAHLTAFR